MRRFKFLFVIALVMLCLVGCGKSDKKNADSKLVKVKENMLSSLKNYSYDMESTADMGFMNVTTEMNCKSDNVNKIVYCSSETMGVETEQYIDYKNKVEYSKITTAYGYGENDGEWTKTKLNNNISNWLDMSDYVFNLSEESKNGGTYYKGTIDSKKIAASLAQADSSIDYDKIISKDINIEIYVNSLNYIETMNFTMEVMGITEYVEITFKDFNTSGSITIPSSIK